MSNYNSLKATIDANIKQNGNQEITGQILNSVLNQMVNILGTGYQFAGIATIDTNPGTPDAKVFYIANGKGTYEKFGGIEVTEDEVVVLYWDSAWHKVSTGIASQAKLSELEGVLQDLDGDTLYITDKVGNVIAKIDKKGLSTTEVETQSINPAYTDAFYITDKNGNVIFKADKDGIVYPEKNVQNGLKGYELFSIGDSLSSGGQWQQKVAEITGCAFDQTKNAMQGNELSVGGTISYGAMLDNGFWRTKRLIDSNYIDGQGENAIVVIENVNDCAGVTTFDPTAKTYKATTPIDNGYRVEDFSSTLLNGIPSANRTMNAIINLHSTRNGINMAITSLPTSEGDVTLTIGSSATTSKVNIHVVPQSTSQATRQYVLDKILEYNYPTIIDTLADDGVSVDFAAAHPSHQIITYSFNGGTTGMDVSFSETDNAKRIIPYFFNGDALSEWTDTSKWLDGNSFNFSMAYKSIIEMLQSAYPKIHIFIVGFPVNMCTPSDFLRANGTYDMKSYSTSSRRANCRHHIDETLRSVSTMYNVPLIDLDSIVGINVINYLTFYPTNNIHPNVIGYSRFGECLAKQIVNFLNGK